DHIRGAKAVKREEPVKVGDVAAAFKQPGLRIVEAEYEWPFQSHACMGPACALAEVQSDSCTVWSGSQKPHYVRNGVAALLGMPEEKVRTIWVTGPGSYGRNDAGDAALEAAFLAKAVGKPVRVQGMRADGTAGDPKGPASLHRARAALHTRGAKPRRWSDWPGSRHRGEADLDLRRAGRVLRLRQQAPRVGDDRAARRQLLAASHRAPARSSRAGAASRVGIVHGRARRRGGRGSGRLPPQIPLQSAPCRGGEGGG